MRGKCTNLFPKYWNNGHFLMGNKLYIYKKDDLSQDYLYLNKWMVDFVKDLGYLGGVTPRYEASQKCVK